MAAAFVVGGSMVADTFLAFFEQLLVCRRSRTATSSSATNLLAHKGAAALKTIEVARAGLLYLARYVVELNPIEQGFRKLKAFLCRAAERTNSRHCGRMHTLLDAVRTKECASLLDARRLSFYMAETCSRWMGGPHTIRIGEQGHRDPMNSVDCPL